MNSEDGDFLRGVANHLVGLGVDKSIEAIHKLKMLAAKCDEATIATAASYVMDNQLKEKGGNAILFQMYAKRVAADWIKRHSKPSA